MHSQMSQICAFIQPFFRITLRQQPKPLPLAAILGDDGYLPKALDAVLYVLERPTTIDLCPDFLCQRPIATFFGLGFRAKH